jgi:hypothetical protein
MRLPQPTHLNYAGLLNDIDRGRIKIPQFQRDFVWSIEKSAKLIDSLLKGYPIGTLIFWATRDRLRSVRNIGGIDLPPPKDGDVVQYVLDGQQRLTSLFAAIRGLKIERSSGAPDDFSSIYLNLAAAENEQIAIHELENANPATCIRLGELLHGDFQKLATFPKDFQERIKDYKTRIEGYQFPIIEVQDVAIDIATEIFTRINVGGKPLSVFEIMVAKTYDEVKGFDLSQEFDNLIERLEQINYETISDALVLQLIALLLKRDCRRRVILTLGREEFISTWPMAVAAIETAAEYLRNSYRIPVSRLLPYNALLVPFAYYFYQHKDKPDGDAFERLRDFFWRCSLGGRYSVSVESRLAQDIDRIDTILSGKVPAYDWGVDLSPEFIIANGWFGTGRAFVKAILCLLAYHEPKSFSDGATVRISNDWLKQANSRNYHHFFPRAWLRGHVDDERANNIVNITIVDDYLNKRRIGAKPPSQYMAEFAKENKALDATMRTHLIDPHAFGIADNDYAAFLKARAERISEELKERVIRIDKDAERQAVRNDDTEEPTTGFE